MLHLENVPLKCVSHCCVIQLFHCCNLASFNTVTVTTSPVGNGRESGQAM